MRLQEAREVLIGLRSEIVGTRQSRHESDGTMKLDDLAAMESVRAVHSHRERDLGGKLRAIDDALERIARGTYGVCKDCGEPIADGRLLAIPWTKVCISCKEKESDQVPVSKRKGVNVPRSTVSSFVR